MKNKLFRALAMLLCSVFLLSCLVSCKSLPLKSDKKSLEVVGKVGDFDVTYEELYFLVASYRIQLDKKYGASEASSDEYVSELKKLIEENIVSNYAVLKLAKDSGLSLDSDIVKDTVQSRIDAYIESDFGGKRSNYKKSLEEMGTTDNYVRFSIGVDVLYSLLISEYLDTGVINDDEEFIKDMIDTEFIRTKHIMILNGDGDSENYKRAQEALTLLNSGTSIDKVIGGTTYNEDLLIPYDGYYFARGSMDETYEKAAYELEVGEISGIVESVGENPYSGESESCYYIIQRFELEDEYINKNFDTLSDMYFSSVVYDMVSELRSTLTFSFNDYGRSLDILELEEPKQSDPVVYIWVLSIFTVVVLITAIVILVVLKKKNRSRSLLSSSRK